MSIVVEPGVVLNNQYEIIKKEGRGGFSIVWLAVDVLKNRSNVALKIYAPDKGLDDDDLLQFEREYSMTARLEHANLLKSTDYFVHEDSPCLVMEYMANGSLYKKIREQKSLPEKEVAKVIFQVAAGLKYLHSQRPQILHLDIKPENILINYSGNYILADFGISMEMRDTMLRGSQLRGESISYKTPERFLMQPITAKSDVFSFGVLLYELCEGLMSMDSAPLGQIIAFGNEAPAIQTARYSSTLMDIIAACLHRDPAMRPSAQQLEEWAGHYLSNQETWPELRPGLSSEHLDEGRRTEALPRDKGRQTLVLSPERKGTEALPLGATMLADETKRGTIVIKPREDTPTAVSSAQVPKSRRNSLIYIVLAAALIGAVVVANFFWKEDGTEKKETTLDSSGDSTQVEQPENQIATIDRTKNNKPNSIKPDPKTKTQPDPGNTGGFQDTKTKKEPIVEEHKIPENTEPKGFDTKGEEPKPTTPTTVVVERPVPEKKAAICTNCINLNTLGYNDVNSAALAKEKAEAAIWNSGNPNGKRVSIIQAGDKQMLVVTGFKTEDAAKLYLNRNMAQQFPNSTTH